MPYDPPLISIVFVSLSRFSFLVFCFLFFLLPSTFFLLPSPFLLFSFVLLRVLW